MVARFLFLVFVFSSTALAFSTNSAAQNWPSYGGDGGAQYSPLSQISGNNIRRLRKVWVYQTGDYSYGDENADATALEVNPIYVNDSVYVCSAFGRIISINPASGKEEWAFDPGVVRAGSPLGIHICRGVSYWENSIETESARHCDKRIFFSLIDGRIGAVDADEGTLCQGFGTDGYLQVNDFDNVNEGFVGHTSPPLIAGDKVIIGGVISSYSEILSPNGIVRALDVRSGEVVWEWNPIPEALRKKIGGVNVWPPMSYDSDLGIIYLPTGSATVDPIGAHRQENIPYANALVALDAATGVVRWHFQIVRHDLWDYDLPSQPMLVDILRDGVVVPAVIQNTKMGFIFAFDRVTGHPLFEIEDRTVPPSDVSGEVASATQPFPVTPGPLSRSNLSAEEAFGFTPFDRGNCRAQIQGMRNEGLYTPPSIQGSVQLPNGYGGVNWGNASFDPDRNYLIVGATQVANVSRLIPEGVGEKQSIRDHSNFDVGGPLEGAPYQYKSQPILSQWGVPCSPPPWGTMTAVDMKTGEFVWRKPFGQVPAFGPFRSPKAWGSPLVGGPLATGGGVVFMGGALDHFIRAVDIESGKVLWKSRLPAPGNATPMTYEHEGVQYVVIAAGGNAVAGTKLGGAIVAFSLPERELKKIKSEKE